MTPTQPEEPRGSSQLSRLCAVMLVLLHALEILIRRIEVMARREGLYMEHENKQATCQNFQVRKFGDPCPIDNGIEVDIYNCTNCEHYFAPASKSIICKKTDK